MLATSRPRYSATTIACAVATWAVTSAIMAAFASRFNATVCSYKSLAGQMALEVVETGDLRTFRRVP